MGKAWKNSLLETKTKVLQLYEQGLRHRSIARRLNLDPANVCFWCTTIDLYGKDSFLAMSQTKMKYTYETKLAAVKAVVEDGRIASDVMREYGIRSGKAFKAWRTLYRTEGAKGLLPKKKGRPTNSSQELSREQKLLKQIEELKLENEILKKVLALKSS